MKLQKRLGLAILIALLAMGILPGTATNGNAKTTIVAAVQTVNLDNQYERSREMAERLIVEAAKKGARLILLPEFALIGYRFHDEIWNAAEPLEGPTVAWMRGLCKRHNIYLATCILEVKGDDFHDTAVLVGPGEGELWAHRKIEPALYEARYFKGGGINPAVFETPLGRIGIIICYDTSKTHTAKNLLDGNPDIVLMTFSAPETPVVPERMANLSIRTQNELPGIYADILGVPVISCNKTGRWDSPLPGVPGANLRSDFVARSRIVDAGGNVLAALEKQEAVLLAEVEIGGQAVRKPHNVPEGRWLVNYDPFMRSFSDLTLKMGIHRYNKSAARKRAVEKAKQRHAANK